MENKISPPHFIYGTAWKEERTENCVLQALTAGFRAIDTANQRKHYFEDGVGTALVKAYEILGLKRTDLFLQTKFTFADGQDHRKPYDENSKYSEQVQASFNSSLEHLRTEYIDSLVLHGPYDYQGVSPEDRETWTAMEKLFHQKHVRALGLSNVNLPQLKGFFEFAKIKPVFVQNRCYAQAKWDQEIRNFCKSQGIHYQGFSLLTANTKVFSGVKASAFLKSLMVETKKQLPQLVFRFSQQIGMIPLTGTTSLENMKMDQDIQDFELSPDQMASFENLASL